MRWIVDRIKPARGFSHLVHLCLVIALPIVLLVLVRLQGAFVQVALSLVLLSKWRMFAVRPRFWATNIRSSGVDIIVGLSAVLFMALSTTGYFQLLWAGLYAVWLLVIKPATGTILVAAQALIGQLCGLTALFLVWTDGPLAGLVVAGGIVCYIAAGHFFDNFDEPYARLLAYLWGYVGAATIWVLGHWLLFYGVIAQPTLLLCLVGYGLAMLYYFDHRDKLSTVLRRYTLLTMLASVLVVLITTWIFGGWGNKVV